MADVTEILQAVGRGEHSATEELLVLLYNELRQLAADRLAKEKPGQTLQTTALVHEVYLRLMQGTGQNQWENRGHFFAAAAEAMRRIVIEQVRKKKCLKREVTESVWPWTMPSWLSQFRRNNFLS